MSDSLSKITWEQIPQAIEYLLAKGRTVKIGFDLQELPTGSEVTDIHNDVVTVVGPDGKSARFPLLRRLDAKNMYLAKEADGFWVKTTGKITPSTTSRPGIWVPSEPVKEAVSTPEQSSIAKKVADLLAKGEEVYSNSVGRFGKVLKVDGNSVYLKMPNGRRGVTGFRSRDVDVVKNHNSGKWTIIDIGPRNSWGVAGGVQKTMRESIKESLKAIILSEITQNQFGTSDTRKGDKKEIKAVNSVVDDAKKIVGTGKVSGGDETHYVELKKIGTDLYDVTSVTNESDRRVGKEMSLEKAMEFAKKHAEETETSYVDKARAKSINSGEEKKESKKDEKPEDKMEETKEKTQSDVADKNDKKAEEKADKKLSAVNKDNSPQLGGEIVDKIDKIIDRVLKKNTIKLKADPEMESSDKRVVKVKETPELKGKKS